MSETVTSLKRPTCPICGRESAKERMPFCSARCADVDLSRWLTGSYAIPAEDDEERPEDGRPSIDS